MKMPLRCGFVLVVCGALHLSRPSLPAADLPGYQVVSLGRGNLNRLLLAVTIEGKKGLFVLDTGASGTVVNQEKYAFLLPGPDRQLPAGVPAAANMNGTQTKVGVAKDFYIGNANLGTLALRVAPARYLYDQKARNAEGDDRQYDGYLGEDILRRANAIIDVGRLGLYINTDPKHRIDPGRGLVAAGWTRVPMTAHGRDFTVVCTLGKKRVRMYVDTGAPFTVLDERAVRMSLSAVMDIPMRSGIVATRAREMAMVKTDSLVIGSFVATGVHLVSQQGLGSTMNTNYDESDPIAGLLGGDILGRNNALIDIANQALYLKAPGSKR